MVVADNESEESSEPVYSCCFERCD